MAEFEFLKNSNSAQFFFPFAPISPARRSLSTCSNPRIHDACLHNNHPCTSAESRVLSQPPSVRTASFPIQDTRGHGSWSANFKPDTIKSLLFFRGPQVVNLPAVKSLPPNFKTRCKYPEIKTSRLKRLLSYSRRLRSSSFNFGSHRSEPRRRVGRFVPVSLVS
ncbi:hypothetical protein DFH09DRAFT_1289153, partial [Mycena vulgaris]